MSWLRALAAAGVLLWTLWSSAALWIDGPASRPLAAALAALPVVGFMLWLLRTRPLWRAAARAALLPALTTAWWLSLEPSNDRDWLPDVARLAVARIDGDLVTISNVRDFAYRSEEEYSERWEERSYDLSKLVGVDMFFSYWGSPHIAHTITSWEFSDGQHLAISIETRKEQGEAYSAVLGFFRQFELYYVVADERDLIGVRAAHRGEEVYLYRLATPVPVARAVLLDYLHEINRLAAEAAWYNALTYNCTTSIRRHVRNVAPGNPFDWRILVNGHLPALGYERGRLVRSLPFEELRVRSDITAVAVAADGAPDFSARIRRGLPGARRDPRPQSDAGGPSRRSEVADLGSASGAPVKEGSQAFRTGSGRADR